MKFVAGAMLWNAGCGCGLEWAESPKFVNLVIKCERHVAEAPERAPVKHRMTSQEATKFLKEFVGRLHGQHRRRAIA